MGNGASGVVVHLFSFLFAKICGMIPTFKSMLRPDDGRPCQEDDVMAFEKIGKVLGNIASTTAKKAGEQVQITKLGIDRAGLEKQIEGVYAAIGRYCYSKAKAGESLPEEMLDYCRDIDLLYQQIEEIDEEISQHKSERDAAEYTVSSGLSGSAEQPLSFDASFEPAREDAPAQDGVQEETVESATAALDEADGK